MDWTDDGIVLGARPHGESSSILSLLTREHGRHVGLVRGGAGRRARGLYEPGNEVRATWQARLSEHLGTYRCEPLAANAAEFLDDPQRLMALAAAAAVADAVLPEREPHPKAYEGFKFLLGDLASSSWAETYVHWEIALLAELGFGLDFRQCAATGVTRDLIYVSPRTGRAVSEEAGAPYRERLLRLPGFLAAEGGRAASAAEIAEGLALTGFFLARHVWHQGREPGARTRLIDRMGHFSTISSEITLDEGSSDL